MKKWLIDFLVGIDKTINLALGGDGEQTLTYRASASRCVLCRLLCGFLDLIDRGHCARYGKRREGHE